LPLNSTYGTGETFGSSRDTQIPPNETTNGDAALQGCPYAAHDNSTGPSSYIGTKHYGASSTGCSDHSSSSLPQAPLNPIDDGQVNALQENVLERSQAPTFYLDENLFPCTQILQSTLVPVPAVGWGENHEAVNQMFLQTQSQYQAADGLEDSSGWYQTMNPVDMGILSSMPAGIDHNLQDSWAFYNPQAYPAQTTYPQMAFSTVPSPLGHLFQIYTPPSPRIYCTWPLCIESFARPGDLERHRQSVHLGIKHHCFWPGCHNNHGKGYVRCDKLKAHQKEKHGFA
jgi:hypothetical protein